MTRMASPPNPHGRKRNSSSAIRRFLGGSKIRRELGDEYSDELFALYADRISAFSDLVCYWFERARAQVQSGKATRVGLLATQAIRGGANRGVLDRIKGTGEIFFAWSDRDWLLDGAAVHVSMVGFDSGTETQKILDGKSVSRINADLTTAEDTTSALILEENAGLWAYGSQQKGAFDLPPEPGSRLRDSLNPFGRQNADVIKRSVNGKQILRRTEDSWVIDFGEDMPLSEAALYEEPFEYVKRVILPTRENHPETRQRMKWWLHARPSPKYRAILESHHATLLRPCWQSIVYLFG